MEIRVTLHNQLGLHARPAALLAQCAARFAATVTVATGHSSTDARSILGLLSLCAPTGTELMITAEGSDAAEAIAAIQTLCDGNFGEA